MAAQVDLKDCSLEIVDRAATLTLKRDDVRNTITGTHIVEDIVATLNWVNATPEISVLVITGEGKTFSAGGNLKLMEERAKVVPHLDYETNRRGIQSIPLAFEQVEVPVIAAINGPAIGGGFDIACMCDMRIASDTAKFAETYINLGMIPSLGGVWYLERLVGYQKAAELTLTGRIIDAAEAKEFGLLLEVLEPDALMDRVGEVAASIAAKPPFAVRAMKRLLKRARYEPLPEFLEVCATYQALCHKTEDHAEAVDAVLAKRRPKFHGR